ADGQEPLPVAGPKHAAQGIGASARIVDRSRPAETPRAGNLSQYRGVGSERTIRRGSRQPVCIQQAGARAHSGRGGVACSGAAQSPPPQRKAPGAGRAQARRHLSGTRGGTGGARKLRQAWAVVSTDPERPSRVSRVRYGAGSPPPL